MNIEKRNIFLTETERSLPYSSASGGPTHAYPHRDNPSRHAAFISMRLQECRDQSLTQKQVAAIKYKEGTYLEFSGKAGSELKVLGLEDLRKGIRLLNVKHDADTDEVKATVYVPNGQESFFLSKVEKYVSSLEEGDTPKNNDLVRSIEDVKLAMLSSFWVGNPQTVPEVQPVWCEVWLRFSSSVEEAEYSFVDCCKTLGITVKPQRIVFPERLVKLVLANQQALTQLISMCDYLAEMRRAPEAVSFFDTLPGKEQKEWANELLERTVFSDSNATVCLLDRGLSSANPLIIPATREEFNQSVNPSWGTQDDDGHGTEMAGISVYYDLKEKLVSADVIEIPHKIESVKILPPKGENPVELYGAITEQAVALAEIANAHADRTICMAVTAPDNNTGDGSPTSWSATLDSITSGATEEGEKRLFFVSAGNVCPYEMSQDKYPEVNILHSVENPGQSWNALTVGAFSKDVLIQTDEFKGFSAVADIGSLSPFSSTSLLWNSKWPIKPEILLNGGNMATNGSDYTECPDLSLLTTSGKPLERIFSTINATSSATAQAAWMAAQLYAEYPSIWPETVRALIVHSARWTDEMRNMFCKEDQKTKGRKRLLRTCGYGIPNLQRAIQCMSNSVNMVIQGELQPYEPRKMKEMHIHEIPWPTEVLRSLGDAEVELRVTLSYFVEPGPGEKGWKDRYRYPSHGLRFDIINSDETIDDFQKRVNVRMRGEDQKDKGAGTSGSDRWYLGSDNRDVGSIHSDFITCNAVDLCEAKFIAVYPVVGWWRERAYLGKAGSTARYSLVVSISTPLQDVDFYTPIITQIPTSVKIEIPTMSN